jgi:hypothetical protein
VLTWINMDSDDDMHRHHLDNVACPLTCQVVAICHCHLSIGLVAWHCHVVVVVVWVCSGGWGWLGRVILIQIKSF